MTSRSSISSKLIIVLESYEQSAVEQVAQEISEVARRSGAQVCGPIPFPNEKKVFDVRRSPHIYYEAVDQILLVRHKRVIHILNSNVNTTSSLNNVALVPGVEISLKEESEVK